MKKLKSLIVFHLLILSIGISSTLGKADYLKSISWNVPSLDPIISKTFASDVETRRQTDLEQVLTDMITLFNGGHPCTIFVTGASVEAYQPLLTAGASILGHTPQIGSYLSSRGTNATDPRSPVFVIYVEKESMGEHEHQLAVFAHEYYHVYQNAQLLENPKSAEPYTWVMEGGAKLFETLYVSYKPNTYTYKQENITELLTETKNYYDANSFNFGVGQETHDGINPTGTSNYNVASVAMVYLAHLSSYYKVLSTDLYALAHEKGFDNAFSQQFGMNSTQFYASMNSFFKSSSLAEVQAIAPKTKDLPTLLAKPDLTDTDGDGLSKYDETVRYGTSDSLTDTDSDGISDKQEVDLALDPLAGLGDFSSANNWGTGWKELSGFGYYFESSKPWYFHKGMGWFYAQELEFSNLWVYFTYYGWCWTSQNIFPFFYQDKENNWIHYSSSNSNSFYRYQNNAWTLIE